MPQRPNIVWLFPDQHRADVIGAAGHPVVRTPNVDALAARGAMFEHLYCQGPLCIPSRVSLLTERYVRDHGVFENAYPAPDQWPTIVQAIREAGYHTTAIGKMHLFPHPRNISEGLPRMHHFGFDEVDEVTGKLASASVDSAYTDYLAEEGVLDVFRRFIRERTPSARLRTADNGGHKPTWTVDPSPLAPEQYLDAWVGRRAAQWIDDRASTDDPFFLWVGFPGPHDPWDAPAEYVRAYEDVDIPLDSTRRPELPDEGPLRPFLTAFLNYSSSDTLTDDRAREVRRHYFANVTLIDEAIGDILAALERKGIAGDTWVVYSSDHGEMLGTHGLLNKMVFYEPSTRVPLIIRPPGGTDPVRVPGLFEHVDLSATLRSVAGAADIEDGAGASLLPAVTGDGPLRGRESVVSENYGFAMWRTDRYKLVVYEKDHQPVQLFDLLEDPGEDRNLVGDASHSSVVRDMLDAFTEPFLASPPNQPGPDIVERAGTLTGRRQTSTA